MSPEEKLAIVWVVFLLVLMGIITWAVWNRGD